MSYQTDLASGEIWDIDLPPIRVSPEALRVYGKGYRLDTRLALGRICTMEQFEKDRERILAKPLR